MARHRNTEWNLNPVDEKGCLGRDQIQIAILMDIRDELRDLNSTLRCQRVREGFMTMRTAYRYLRQKFPLKPKGKKNGKRKTAQR